MKFPSMAPFRDREGLQLGRSPETVFETLPRCWKECNSVRVFCGDISQYPSKPKTCPR